MDKILNLHTDGNEFYLTGTTDKYTGYYNSGSAGIFTGRSFMNESISLIPISTDSKVYSILKPAKLPDPITIFVPSPTDTDYTQGWFMRYFARQANTPEAPFYEIDEVQHTAITGGQKPIYIAVQLRWKISGPKHDIDDNLTLKVIEPGVSNTNDRSIRLIESFNPTLRNRLQNLVEFWKGEQIPYFAPPLTKRDNTLLV
mgnify:CR=1 FL=1